MTTKPAPDLTFLMLVNEYGNAVFECGAWDDDEGRTYEDVYARAELARTALIEALETRQELLEALKYMVRAGEGCVTGNPRCEPDCCRYGRAHAAIAKAEAAK